MTRAQLEKLLKAKVTVTEDTTVTTLEDAQLEPSDIDTVLMVGGSSRIPVFQQMLERMFGKPPVFSRNLDEDVARGAAMLGAKEGTDLDPRSALARIPKPVDVASHGYGIEALNDDETDVYNSIIIDPNTAVPAFREKTYVTVEEGQTLIAVKMNEGEEEDLQYVKQIASGDADFGRQVPKGYPMRVTIELTRAGIIELNAYDGETGALMRKLVVKRMSILSADQQASARQELARWKVG
jgi:molecular chaperone DnaK